MTEIDVTEIDQRRLGEFVFIDIRERHERELGAPETVLEIPQRRLEIEVAKLGAQKPIVLICASGKRSLAAAKHFVAAGYSNVKSLKGGVTEWRRHGLPWQSSRHDKLLTEAQHEKYSRQTVLPEIGLNGQTMLLRKRVLIVGLGGLGSPVLKYLAAAGVGTLGLVDDDQVEFSNLARQIAFGESDVGSPKTQTAAKVAREQNSDCVIEPFVLRITDENAKTIVESYDVIVDCADNFETSFALSDAASSLKIPIVHGSVYRFEGQVFVSTSDGNAKTYRDLVSPTAADAAVDNCATAGVVGPLPGIVGSVQALEVMKLLLGLPTLQDEVIVFDGLNQTFDKFSLI